MGKKSISRKPEKVIFSKINEGEIFVYFTFEKDCKRVFLNTDHLFILQQLTTKGFVVFIGISRCVQTWKCVKKWNSKTLKNI